MDAIVLENGRRLEDYEYALAGVGPLNYLSVERLAEELLYILQKVLLEKRALEKELENVEEQVEKLDFEVIDLEGRVEDLENELDELRSTL